MPFIRKFKEISAPKQSYDFNVIIGEMDYTAELRSVRIVASIYVPYQIYILDLSIDSNDLIQEKVYGQTPIKFKMKSSGDSGGDLLEEDSVELLVISSSFLLTPKDKISANKQIDRTPVQIICVERKNFKLASKTLNDVYEAKTIKEILQSITSKMSMSLDMDMDGLNKQKINQIIIPPTPLCNAIRQHIDKPFGIYNGPYQLRIDHKGSNDSTPTLYLRNLSKQMSSTQEIVIHQLSLNNDQNYEIIKKCGDGVNFYTKDVHRSNFNANPVFASVATVVKHITKPLDSLYHTITQNLDQLSQKCGLMSKSDGKIPFDDALKERTRYYTGQTGFEKDSTFANAMMSKQITSLANITLTIQRAFKMHKLLNVGKPVKFNTYITEFANLAGNYILSGTDLIFSKDKMLQWTSIAQIRMIRSHKEI